MSTKQIGKRDWLFFLKINPVFIYKVKSWVFWLFINQIFWLISTNLWLTYWIKYWRTDLQIYAPFIELWLMIIDYFNFISTQFSINSKNSITIVNAFCLEAWGGVRGRCLCALCTVAVILVGEVCGDCHGILEVSWNSDIGGVVELSVNAGLNVPVSEWFCLFLLLSDRSHCSYW